MKFTRLNIDHFGKFEQVSVTFDEGIQLVCGENEAGKTTIYTFIKAMLFGMERGRGRAAGRDEYTRYMPWEGQGSYGGSLEFLSGGRKFRLERRFDKYGKRNRLFCMDDGEELSVEDGDLEVLLDGMTEETFENTIAIGQQKAMTGEGLVRELQTFAASYYLAGNSDLNLEAAQEYLKAREKELDKQAREYQQEKEHRRERVAQEMTYVWRDLKKLEQDEDTIRKMIEETEEEPEEFDEAGGAWKGILVSGISVVFAVLAMVGSIKFLQNKTRLYVIGAAVLVALIVILWNYFQGKRRNRRREMFEEAEEERQSREKQKQWKLLELQDVFREKKTEYGNLQDQLDELDEASEEQKHLEKQRQALQLASETLYKLSAGMRTRLEKDLNEKVSVNLSQITCGKYTKVFVDENLNISVLHEGKKIEITNVSRGTVEQMYLALRMAAAELLLEDDFPIIFDDAFVFYDELRLQETLRWIAKSKKQVLLFTCQKREEEAMQERGIPFHKVLLQ